MNAEGERGRRRWKRWAYACIAVVTIARLPLTFDRLYDPDELEHLHASYSIA